MTFLCAFLLAQIGTASANPDGGVVTSGSATIATAGNTLNITQTTRRATIDWNTFNIGGNETTNFIQPGKTSMTLNRIGSQDPSQIYGTLTSNGKIYLVNPNGLIFGEGSKVDAGSIVATTANIANADFMAGRMNFNQAGKADAAIVLNGTVSAGNAGLAGFVAPSVINNGVITAKLGRVNLASGDTFTMDMYGDSLVSVAVSNETAQHVAANNGIIRADGGTIAMTAAAGRTIVNGLVANTGILQANAVKSKNGKIVLYAEGANAVKGNVAADKGKKSGQSGVIAGGVIDVSGTGAGEAGGDIRILGDTVALTSGAVLVASGMTGGGDIRIGGDYLGTGDTPTALGVLVPQDAIIFNDALATGNGGRTIVWSDGDTYFAGNIYARGGANGGNGGFVETSGHAYLDASGYVDLSAPQGEKGLYFLDPANIAIYGNVDPTFNSTDGTSISLSSSLRLWLDAADPATLTLSYNSMGTTATGAPGANTITVGSASGLVVGGRIRLGAAGAATTATTLGADTYTITAITGTTVTLSSTLSTAYTGSGVYQGYVSSWTDKSGRNNTATQATAAAMPVYVSNAQNGLSVVSFDGSNDKMSMPGADFAFTGTQNYSVVASATSQGGDTVTSPLVGNRDDGTGNFSWMIRALTSNLHLHGSAQYLTGQTFAVNQSNILSTTVSGTSALTANVYVAGGLIQTTPSWTYFGTPGTGLYIGTMYDGSSKYKYQDMTIYNKALSTDERNLMEQYQAAKWGIALSAPGTGATEGAKATSATGYSVFTTRYLERLSQTANVSLQATNNITLDLKGDTLNFATAGRSLSLTGANIAATSAGAINTNNGAVTMTASGTLDTSKISMNTGTAAISLSSAGAMKLGTMTAGTITARSTGATADLTIDTGKILTGSGTGTAITLAAGQNFINNGGAGALATPAGRWLVYSKNPANDTVGVTSGFRRFSCTYLGACPSVPTTGNGLLYSTTPSLTATPNTITGLTYGDAAPGLTGYGYTLSGYLGSDAGADTVTGSLNGSTTYAQYSGIGNYGINYAAGALASAMGYSISYGNRANAFTVSPAILDIAVKAITKTYGDIYGFGSSDYTVTGLKSTDAVSSVTLASAGAAATANVNSYGVTASGATGTGLGNYTINYTGNTLTVNPASLTVAANSATKTYGNTYNFGSGDYSVTGLLNSDSVASVDLTSTGAAATAGVAAYGITASNASGTGLSNYTITYTGNTLNVTPATLTIAANAATKTYGATYTFGSSDYSVTGLVNSDSVSSVSVTSAGAVATANVAGYGITAASATGTGLGNYTISYTGNTLNVTPATLTIAANAATKTYGSTYSFGSSDYAVTGLLNSDSVSSVSLASAGAAATANVNSYGITAGSASGTGLSNYTIAYTGNTMTVNPASLTVAANSATKTYGNTYNFGSSDYSVTGLQNTDSVSRVTLASAGAASTASVAGYGITASGASGTGLSNYTISYTGNTLNVTPATLTIAANAATKTYGATYNFGTSDYSVTGLLNSDSVSAVSLASAGAAATAGVAGYGVTASGATGTGLGNYSISYTGNTLNVTPATLTIAANAATKTYGATYNFGTSDYSVTGLLNSDSVSGVSLASAGAAATANVNSYGITAASASGTGLANYTISYTGNSMTVNPAALTIAAQDATKVYGATHGFGSDYDVTGLLNSDGVTGVTLASTGSGAAANVGDYALTAAGATGTGLSNYVITYQNGVLSVTPAALVITADNATKPFGTTLNFSGTEFTVNGLKNSDGVAAVTLRSYGRLLNSAPKTYRIEASAAQGTGLSNYTITYVNGALTVTPSAASAALDTQGNADYIPVDANIGVGPRHAIIEITDPLADQLGIGSDDRMVFSMLGNGMDGSESSE